jgi:YHS domain-containing protein
MKTLFNLPALAVTALLSVASSAFAADEYNVSNGLTLTGNPLGMHGVDPVSMLEGDAPQIGDAAFTTAQDGVDYYFATAEAKAAFDANPGAYLPQFGGFCAYGIFVGKKLDGDVRFADIVDGKLYLFVNAVIFEKYLANKDEVLAVAYDKWSGLKSTPIEDL